MLRHGEITNGYISKAYSGGKLFPFKTKNFFLYSVSQHCRRVSSFNKAKIKAVKYPFNCIAVTGITKP